MAFRPDADRPGRVESVLLLAGLCGVLFFYGLNAGDLYRTENLRAVVAAEVLRSGDWIVPRLYGEPLLTKPPGMYAAIALVSWPFGGVNDVTARLPSALAATASVFLFYWYFGRQFGRLGGLVAAATLPASLVWLDKVPSAEIDPVQVAWVTAAILFFLRALEDEESGHLALGPWWFAALLCVAGGVLTKWTAPVFFYATVVPLLWWRGRLRLLLGRHHLLAAAVGAGVCLAWAAAAVYLAGWDEFYGTVSREALQRLSPAHYQDVQRQLAPHHTNAHYPWLSVLAHPFRVLAANLPWSGFALVTLWPGFARLWDERSRRLLQGLHCWTWPSLLFWSVVPEHALRHSFPLFPGLVGLSAMVWVALLTGKMRWPLGRLQPRSALVALVGVWLLAKVVFVEAVLPARNPNRAPRAKGEAIAAAVPAGQPLYVFRLKDEGIMFYYGRAHPVGGDGPPVQRLRNSSALPSSGEPVYCILDEPEWRHWQSAGWTEEVLRLPDEQGSPIVLVRVSRRHGEVARLSPGRSHLDGESRP
jgi:4-amino-4-deoxy-L-arabinose transferase-like glycosyltransferase